jgi:hypothetical protein
MYPRKPKQDWTVGNTVKIGFVSGFLVVEKVATPGDGLPDYYIVERNGKRYRFIPHNGLEEM